MKYIPIKEYLEFRVKFFAENADRTLRLGQAFLNKFYPDLSMPELFYEDDVEKAEMVIYTTFIEFDSVEEQ